MEIGTKLFYLGSADVPAGYCTFNGYSEEKPTFKFEDGRHVRLMEEKELERFLTMKAFGSMRIADLAKAVPLDTDFQDIMRWYASPIQEEQAPAPNADGISIEQMQALTEAAFPSVEFPHTPEPWHVVIKGKLNKSHWIVNKAGDLGMLYRELDAKRIVECVNALAGIQKPTEFVEKAKYVTEHILKVKPLYEALEAERDELVESLVDILARFKSCISGGNGELEDDRPAINRAESAIAKAKGEQS